MKKILQLSFFVFLGFLSRNLTAQNINYGYASFTPNNKIHYIGDQDTIGSFSMSSNCPFTYFSQARSGQFTYIYTVSSYNGYPTSAYGIVLYTPTSTASVTDSVSFYAQTYYNYGSGCQPGETYWSLLAYCTGTIDSIFRIRPNYQPLTVKPDTNLKLWTSHFQMTFDNNTSSPVTIKDWRIKEDSGIYSLQASAQGKVISEYSTKAFERKIPIDFQITLTHGPIYYNTLRHAILEATVTQNGRDSIYRERIDLSIIAPAYKSYSKLEKDTLFFTNDPHIAISKSLLLYLDPAATSYAIAPLPQPFFLNDMKVDDLTHSLTVTCHPKSGGRYIDKLRIDIIKPDFNGDPRHDSLYLDLNAEISSVNDETFWYPSHGVQSAKKLFLPKGRNIYASTGKLLFYSIDGNRSWVALPVPDSSCSNIAFDTNGSIYRIGASNGLFLSSNDGAAWQSLLVPSFTFNCYPNETIPIDIFSVTRAPNALYVSGSKSVSYPCGRSYMNGGLSGTFVLQDNSTSSWQSIGSTGKLYLDSANNVVIITGSRVNYPALNHLSTIPDSIIAFAVDSWGNYLVGTPGRGIFRSPDNAYSWENLPLSEPNITAIATTPSGEIFIASYGNGVFRSTDNGQNWEGVNGGLTTYKVNDIIAVPGQPLYLATDDAWVWKSQWIVPTKNAVKNNAANKNITFDIFPNPTQSAVTIQYSIPENQAARFSVLDMLGKEIELLNKPQLLQGENSIAIDLSTLPTGMYFCKMQSGQSYVMKKIFHF